MASTDPTQLISSGANSYGSPLNQGGNTPRSQMVSANGANTSAAVKKVSPASAFGKVLGTTAANEDTKGVTADWYLYGKPSENKDPKVKKVLDRLPAMIDPWIDQAAVIKVYGYDKKKKKDVELIPGYTKLILESVEESHQERSQIVETFGDFYVFLYGERPPMYSFSGTLINTKSYNWVSDFVYYYETFLRGTKCVEQNARITMMYGGRMIEGFMLGMSMSTNSVNEAGVKVGFSIVVTDRRLITRSEDLGYVMIDGKMVKTDAFKEFLNKVAGPTGEGSSAPAANSAFNAAKGVLSGGPAAAVSSALGTIA